jgi:tol-pal system protein YbgF
MRLSVLILLAVPLASFAANREMQELQRDVGLLQEQVKSLQQAQTEKFSALNTLVQQAVDAAQKANTGVAVIQNGFQQNIKDQESKVVTPVVTVGTRMDQMASDFRTLQQAVSDLTALINKLQAQVTDLATAVKVMQAPPAAPPPPAGSQGSGASAAGVPAIPATELYNNAQRDRTSGKLDIALQEYSDYLKWYGDTDLAPNAQFYIAYVHYSQGDYDKALEEFDAVLEKYPDNNKTPDALYYKGLTLTKQGRRTQGAEEFRELLKRFPNSDLSRQACSQLTTMGLRCATPARAAAPSTKRKR